MGRVPCPIMVRDRSHKVMHDFCRRSRWPWTPHSASTRH